MLFACCFLIRLLNLVGGCFESSDIDTGDLLRALVLSLLVVNVSSLTLNLEDLLLEALVTPSFSLSEVLRVAVVSVLSRSFGGGIRKIPGSLGWAL